MIIRHIYSYLITFCLSNYTLVVLFLFSFGINWYKLIFNLIILQINYKQCELSIRNEAQKFAKTMCLSVPKLLGKALGWLLICIISAQKPFCINIDLWCNAPDVGTAVPLRWLKKELGYQHVGFLLCRLNWVSANCYSVEWYANQDLAHMHFWQASVIWSCS